MNKFDYERIIQLKSDILFHDRPVILKSVIEKVDEWATWDDIGICLNNPNSVDTLYLNKTESIYEHVTPVRFCLENQNNVNEIALKNISGNIFNMRQFVDADEILKSLRTIIISNYEIVNPLCAELVDFLLNVFHIQMDGHGVWPAKMNNYSGYVNMFCGLKGSNWYHPRCDGPNNFIFQIQGKQKLAIYNNRSSALSNVELSALDTIEERKQIYENFQINEEIDLEEGDMAYIPHRQFYHLEPIENTISMFVPLLLSGPLTVSF